jgi:hypothetical protein
MDTLRIPTRYKKTILRLSEQEQAYVFVSLLRLCTGEEIEIQDNLAGDIIYLIYRDCQNMESKTPKNKRNTDNNSFPTVLPTMLPTVSASERKGKEVKEKEEKETKKKYGEYKKVLLTEKQYNKLKEKFGSTLEEKIKQIDEGIEMRGYKYKNHYLAFLNWFDKKDEKTPESEVRRKIRPDWEIEMENSKNTK